MSCIVAAPSAQGSIACTMRVVQLPPLVVQMPPLVQIPPSVVQSPPGWFNSSQGWFRYRQGVVQLPPPVVQLPPRVVQITPLYLLHLSITSFLHFPACCRGEGSKEACCAEERKTARSVPSYLNTALPRVAQLPQHEMTMPEVAQLPQ